MFVFAKQFVEDNRKVLGTRWRRARAELRTKKVLVGGVAGAGIVIEI